MIENSTDNILFDDEYKKFEKVLKAFYINFVKKKTITGNSKISIRLYANSAGEFSGKEIWINDNK